MNLTRVTVLWSASPSKVARCYAARASYLCAGYRETLRHVRCRKSDAAAARTPSSATLSPSLA